MQTFLPYSGYAASAAALDNTRLPNQINEVDVIYETLIKIMTGERVPGVGAGWHNHPAVLMWRGYEESLLSYRQAMLDECRARGYQGYRPKPCSLSPPSPAWLGDDRLHSSHRSMLLGKKPEFYQQFGWEESPNLGYFWPTHHTEYQHDRA